jgi:ubiquinone/menaquinone biosynthesis C-methylase UbiE
MNYKKINEDFYSKSYWGLDRSRRKWFSKYVKIKVLGRFMQGLNREVLYDAGGGVGNYGWFFSNNFKEVIVSDISKIALSKITEKEIRKLNCSVLSNKLPDNYVDCILLIDVFEHIESKDLLEMMKDLRRILKPDGKIIIFTSHLGWGFGAIFQRIFSPHKKLLKNEHEEGHVNRLKYGEFYKIFREAGLAIEDFYFYSIIFHQITEQFKDNFARIVALIKGKKNEDIKLGRAGQSTKEYFRKKEEGQILRIILYLLSRISYLDILIFGKLYPGNTIFFKLKKEVFSIQT